jgi:formate dehydrogenase major subunit
VAGLAAAFGSGAMTNTIADIETADVILITGSNTSENHPVLSSFVKRAKKFRGAKVIVVDPRRIKMTEFADYWLRPNLGSDVAWINGLMHVVLSEEMHDQAFIDDRTEGFEEFKKTVEKYTPEFVEGITGIPAEQLVAAAKLFAGPRRPVSCYCMGITQHISAVRTMLNLWPIWPCSAVPWAYREAASTRFAARTMFRVPVTWAVCPMSTRPTSPSPTTGPPRRWKRPGA